MSDVELETFWLKKLGVKYALRKSFFEWIWYVKFLFREKPCVKVSYIRY